MEYERYQCIGIFECHGDQGSYTFLYACENGEPSMGDVPFDRSAKKSDQIATEKIWTIESMRPGENFRMVQCILLYWKVNEQAEWKFLSMWELSMTRIRDGSPSSNNVPLREIASVQWLIDRGEPFHGCSEPFFEAWILCCERSRTPVFVFLATTLNCIEHPRAGVPIRSQGTAPVRFDSAVR